MDHGAISTALKSTPVSHVSGMVSSLHATGGGRLVAVVCVDGHGHPLMPCGRCRQLLWENGGPDMLLETVRGVRPMSEVLPDAFGPEDLDR